MSTCLEASTAVVSLALLGMVSTVLIWMNVKAVLVMKMLIALTLIAPSNVYVKMAILEMDLFVQVSMFY